MTPEIRRVADAPALYQAAAVLFEHESAAAVRAGGVFNVALAGGSTPRGLYRLLADNPHLRTAVPWDRIHFFWSDERHVPPDHPESNYRMAYEAMLSKVPVRVEYVHRIKAEHADAALVSGEYEADVRTSVPATSGVPRFDLILLGVGADGHTASLFPDTSALSERARLVVANRVGEMGTRITMTLPLLNAARLVMFLVAGEQKAEAVWRALQPGSSEPAVPAALVQPVDGRLVWLLDSAAAGRLPKIPA
ncbi:MAG TPA: 6-phosphogluconolactonase [Vicinamibacterales bacterium]|nr:6-phosphogluconolactonase [Vicinamibacterales bacterium]